MFYVNSHHSFQHRQALFALINSSVYIRGGQMFALHAPIFSRSSLIKPESSSVRFITVFFDRAISSTFRSIFLLPIHLANIWKQGWTMASLSEKIHFFFLATTKAISYGASFIANFSQLLLIIYFKCSCLAGIDLLLFPFILSPSNLPVFTDLFVPPKVCSS